jgi:hypothetical protein
MKCSLARGITHMLGNDGTWQRSKSRMKTDRNKREDCERQTCYSDMHHETEAQSAWNEHKVSEKKPIRMAYPISQSKQRNREVCKLWRGTIYNLLDLTVVSIIMPCGSAPFDKKFAPWNRVLLEKLTCSQLVNKFPALYRTRWFITAFTTARHPSVFWATDRNSDGFFSQSVSLRRYPVRYKSASTIINCKHVILYNMHHIKHVYFIFKINLTINYACHFLDICIYYTRMIISWSSHISILKWTYSLLFWSLISEVYSTE